MCICMHAQANEKSKPSADVIYFPSKIASEYDERYAKTIGPLEDELKANMDLIGTQKNGRLLDYACGTGLLSRVCTSGPQNYALRPC